MPDYVQLYAIIFALIMAFILASIIYALARLLSSLPKSASATLAIILSCLVTGWYVWISFGTHHYDLDITIHNNDFPELTTHDSIPLNGYEWNSGLSYGVYYQFQISQNQFNKFVRNNAFQKGSGDYHDVMNHLVSPQNPEWITSPVCENGDVYYIDRDERYFTFFDYYYCPEQNILYAGKMLL